MLAQQGFAHHQRVERRHEGAHRQPVDGGGGDQRQIAHARQGKLQGARDRRGRQGQHMHIGFQVLQPFLVHDAEMLLLVDDDQAQALELDAFGQQRMGADHDIHRAFGQGVLGFLCVFRVHEARQLPHFERKTSKAFGKAAKMLARQQGGGHHHGHLLAGHGSDKGGAHGDFGFAKADIAAH